MLSRNLYKIKKTPLSEKRKKTLISGVLVFSIFFIFYGVYSFQKMKPANGQKQEIKLETGDRPLKKNEEVYVNAEKGLTLRKDRDAKSERLTLIPDKTKLEAIEELSGWYKVNYNGKEGWIAKEYTTSQAPAEDPLKDWQVFSGKGYKVKYQSGWKVKDFGVVEMAKASSLVAFSNSGLPETIPAGTEFVAPITARISTQTIDEVRKNYAGIGGVVTEEIAVGGVGATKYTYTSVLSNTQMTAVVFSASSKVFILDESGGYADDLANMIKTFTLGG